MSTIDLQVKSDSINKHQHLDTRPTVTADTVKAYIDNLDLSMLGVALDYGARVYLKKLNDIQMQSSIANHTWMQRWVKQNLGDLIEGGTYKDSTGKSYSYKINADAMKAFVGGMSEKQLSFTNDELRRIYHNVFMPKDNEGNQIKFESFKKECERVSVTKRRESTTTLPQSL